MTGSGGQRPSPPIPAEPAGTRKGPPGAAKAPPPAPARAPQSECPGFRPPGAPPGTKGSGTLRARPAARIRIQGRARGGSTTPGHSQNGAPTRRGCRPPSAPRRNVALASGRPRTPPTQPPRAAGNKTRPPNTPPQNLRNADSNGSARDVSLAPSTPQSSRPWHLPAPAAPKRKKAPIPRGIGASS